MGYEDLKTGFVEDVCDAFIVAQVSDVYVVIV